jgi:fumarylacetoacetase
MKTWIHVPDQSDFSIYNIPFGVFSIENTNPRLGVAIGQQILDLAKAYELGIFKGFAFSDSVFKNEFLNDFISLGKETTAKIRSIIQVELCDPNSILKKIKRLFYNKMKCKCSFLSPLETIRIFILA